MTASTPMLTETTLIAAKWKIFAPVVIGLALWIADETLNPKGWEDVTLKAAMGFAILWLIRELSAERNNARLDREKAKEENAQREDKMIQCFDSHRETLEKLNDTQQKLVTHFDHFGEELMRRGLESKTDPLGAPRKERLPRT